MLSIRSRATTLLSSKLVFDKPNQERANLLGHELVSLSIWMDTITMHRRRVASLRRAVCNDDGRLCCVLSCGPGGNRGIDGPDLTVVHRQRNNFINLPCPLYQQQLPRHSVSIRSIGIKAYNDFHLGVRSPHLPNHLGVRTNDIICRSSVVNIVGTEHKLHDVWLADAKPTGKIVVGNVDGLPARMAFVVSVKSTSGRLAVFGVVVHRADHLNFVGKICGGQLSPDNSSPAGDFGD